MYRTSPASLLIAFLLLSSLGGCVKRSTHEAALAEARTQRQELREDLEARLDACREEMVAVAAQRDSIRSTLQATEERRARAASRFEEASQEVHRLEAILNERGAEYRRLQQRLDQLRAIEREVRQRNQIYEDVIQRFRSLIDSDRLSVSIDRGRMVIQLSQDVLFNSGSATLSSEGRRTLTEVATVLAELQDRRFQVEGHTDTVPIATERFRSNWELSTARALSVVRLLLDHGVSPDNLSAAGYGEHQPVASNDTPEGRRRNRRIEIVMLPNLDVIAGTQVP